MCRKVIALDLGKVCVDFDSGNCVRALGLESIDQVPAALLDACADFELGRLDQRAWLAAFRSAAGDLPDAQIYAAFTSIIQDELPGMADFAREAVASGCRLVAFSDTSPLHLDEMRLRISFAHLLTGGVYSFTVGERKPHQKMFETLERRYGVPILYADDKPDNVEAARARGWNAHLFEGADGVRSALRHVLKQRKT